MRASTFLALPLLLACGTAPPTIEPEDPPYGASAAQQLFVWSTVLSIPRESRLDGCPRYTGTDTDSTIEGDCIEEGTTDWIGTAWLGTARYQLDEATGTSVVTFTDFGWQRPDCETITLRRVRVDGTMTIRQQGDTQSFELRLTDIQADTCGQPIGAPWMRASGGGQIDYDGTRREERLPDDSSRLTFQGHGTFSAAGYGPVEAETIDEIIEDSVCSGEAASGLTRIHAGAHVAEIHYDGVSRCDSPPTVQWTLDGIDQGDLTGVACSVRPGLRAGRAPLALIALALGLWMRRRA